MDLKRHLQLADRLVRQHPLPVLVEVCRKPDESTPELAGRLVRAGWEPRQVLEALQPGSAAMIRDQVRTISRELRKLNGGVDAQGQPISPPNWDLISLALWRSVDRWVADSTREATFLGRLWRKLQLQDSVQGLGAVLAETTSAASVAGPERPFPARVTLADLKRHFPDAEEAYLKQLLRAYSGSGSSGFRKAGGERKSSSESSTTASRSAFHSRRVNP